MSELTGRRVAAIAVGAFGVIIAANAVLAVVAVDTFSGTVVDNSYLSSQTFDAERDAQRGLGWQVTPRVERGYLHLDFTDGAGRTPRPAKVSVTVGRPGTNAEDATMPMDETGRGYVAAHPLPKGGWRAEIAAEALDGTRFRQSRSFYVGAE
ncbi:FixH family protein [Amaricoccus solimangrovi]|uniref:FixH family protein n=1 Tax=Amaricoccus solimangrovi TaxID=2589815 RepID=A0A501WTN9_9RHOB|nr:FixH family protein [Amaricoccus solimangrovi]TPE50707.1 FixH family protein [Amaricoccus solimangrovi]